MEQDNELKNTPRNEKVAQHEQHPETVEPSYEDLNNAYKKVQQAMYSDEAEKKKALEKFLNIKDNLLQNAEEHIKNLKTSSSYVERMVEEGHPYEWGTAKRNALLSEKQHIADAESLRSMINKTNQAHAHLMGAYNTFLLRGESDNAERTEHFSKAYSSLRRNVDAEYEKVENLPILKDEKEEILKEIEKNADETEKFYKKTIQTAKEHAEERSVQEKQETSQEPETASEENTQETPLTPEKPEAISEENTQETLLTPEEKGEQVMEKLRAAENILKQRNILDYAKDANKLENIVYKQVNKKIEEYGTEASADDIVKQVDDEVHKNNALKRWYKQKAKGYSRTINARNSIKQYIAAFIELQLYLRSLKSSDRENSSMSQDEIPMFKTDNQEETVSNTGTKRVQIKTENQKVATEKEGEMNETVNLDKEIPTPERQKTPQEPETASEENIQKTPLTPEKPEAILEENTQEKPLTPRERGVMAGEKLREAKKVLMEKNILDYAENPNKLEDIVHKQVNQRIEQFSAKTSIDDIVKQVDDEVHKRRAFKKWHNRQPRTYLETRSINEGIRQYIIASVELQIHMRSLWSPDFKDRDIAPYNTAILRENRQQEKAPDTGVKEVQIRTESERDQKGMMGEGVNETETSKTNMQGVESHDNDDEESIHVVQEGEDDLYSILEGHGMTDAEIMKLMEVLNGDSETIHDIGITSGNLDDMHPGDKINLEKVNEIVHAENATNMFTKAA